LIQGKGQVFAHEGAVLAGRPPGDTSVHDSDDLLAVPPAPTAYRLQNDPAEGSQPEDSCLPSIPVHQVQFEPELAEEAVLAPQGNDPEHRQRLADDLPPNVVRHRVVRH
jgi:hypothetical protein